MGNSLILSITAHLSILVAGPPYLLYFCVKFYAADPCRLHEELTRLVQAHMSQFN